MSTENTMVTTTELDSIHERIKSLREQVEANYSVVTEVMDSGGILKSARGGNARGELSGGLHAYNKVKSMLAAVERTHILATALRRLGKTDAQKHGGGELIHQMNKMLHDAQRAIEAADATCAESMLGIVSMIQSETIQS